MEQGKNKAALERYMIFLSICHTIVVDKGKYNGPSPDEFALVNFAKQMGYSFKERDLEDNVVIELSNSKGQKTGEVKYKLLNILEFNSTRKRMSCIFSYNGRIILMCKGADSIIHDICLSEKSKASEVYKET